MIPAPLRLFLAINLPDAERRAIRAAVEPMRAAGSGVSWVAQENLHLTLKFFGDQAASAVEALARALGPVVRQSPPPVLQLEGLGAFPTLRAPRVIWLGVRPDTRLELLHHDLEIACARAGYDVDGRAFRPHITLGRVRGAIAPAGARALARAARSVRYGGRAAPNSVEIMVSERTPAGSRYAVMISLPTAGAT